MNRFPLSYKNLTNRNTFKTFIKIDLGHREKCNRQSNKTELGNEATNIIIIVNNEHKKYISFTCHEDVATK